MLTGWACRNLDSDPMVCPVGRGLVDFRKVAQIQVAGLNLPRHRDNLAIGIY